MRLQDMLWYPHAIDANAKPAFAACVLQNLNEGEEKMAMKIVKLFLLVMLGTALGVILNDSLTSAGDWPSNQAIDQYLERWEREQRLYEHPNDRAWRHYIEAERERKSMKSLQEIEKTLKEMNDRQTYKEPVPWMERGRGKIRNPFRGE